MSYKTQAKDLARFFYEAGGNWRYSARVRYLVVAMVTVGVHILPMRSVVEDLATKKSSLDHEENVALFRIEFHGMVYLESLSFALVPARLFALF